MEQPIIITRTLLEPKVTASCHSDDYRVEVKSFDATPWFATADDEDIKRLWSKEWGGSAIADTVAEDAAEYDLRVQRMFDYLDTVNSEASRSSCGFECYVNEEEALAWIKQHRPHLFAQMEEE